jgi:hypothetical protein
MSTYSCKAAEAVIGRDLQKARHQPRKFTDRSFRCPDAALAVASYI